MLLRQASASALEDYERARFNGHAPLHAGGEASTAPRITVVIPVLNEAENLRHILPGLSPDYEVIIVDGGSTDGSCEVARELCPSATIMRQTRRGKGNALVCGFNAASGDVIVMLDADGSARVDEIPRFVEALQRGADFAKGSRYLRGGGSADFTWLRAAGNRCLSLVVNVLFRTRYSDLCYGYNAFWSHCLPQLDIDCDGFEVETLINIRACKAGLVVVEVPSFEEKRIHGASNLRVFSDGWRILKTILREWRGGSETAAPRPVGGVVSPPVL